MENVMGIIKNESAQFMLLAGFIIAIGLVITTVMLNNIIFESNMAGEAGGDPIKYDIVNLMRISGDEMKSAYRTANGTNATLKIANFTNQMNNFSANLPMLYALHGEGVNVSWDVSNWDTSLSANFTKNGTADGATNWTVIANVNNATIVVNITQLPFTISIINATKTWQTNYSAAGNWTINNSQIMNNITSAYVIRFINGANVAENYNITGNTTYGILNATVTLSTSDKRASITIPVSVPW